VGLAVLIASATPLYLLASVTYGVRYGILTGIYDKADIVFPGLARILWPFGPLDWWSYITPVVLAVGVAARIRAILSLPILSAMLAFSIIQSIVIVGAFEPFAKFGGVMGIPEPAPYPMLPLILNIALLTGASLFALMSIRRNLRNGLSERTNIQGEQVVPPNGP
jgi:hypothetical protein